MGLDESLSCLTSSNGSFSLFRIDGMRLWKHTFHSLKINYSGMLSLWWPASWSDHCKIILGKIYEGKRKLSINRARQTGGSSSKQAEFCGCTQLVLLGRHALFSIKNSYTQHARGQSQSAARLRLSFCFLQEPFPWRRTLHWNFSLGTDESVTLVILLLFCGCTPF